MSKYNFVHDSCLRYKRPLQLNMTSKQLPSSCFLFLKLILLNTKSFKIVKVREYSNPNIFKHIEVFSQNITVYNFIFTCLNSSLPILQSLRLLYFKFQGIYVKVTTLLFSKKLLRRLSFIVEMSMAL